MNHYGIVPVLCTILKAHSPFWALIIQCCLPSNNLLLITGNNNLTNDWSLENYTSLNNYEF